MKKLILLAFMALTICFPAAIHAADGTPLWTNAVSQFPSVAPGPASARAITVDTNGNSYVAGYYINAQTNSDFLTVKYSPGGGVIWARPKDGAGGNDVATAVTVDANSNVYVVGNSPGVGTGSDFMIVEYNSVGSIQHQARFNSGGSNDDFATALAVNVSGEIFVAGQTMVSATNSTWKTVKYSSGLAALVWTNAFSGAGSGLDQVKAMVADPGGVVYVTGYATDAAGNFDYATVKYSSAGTQLWVNKYSGATNGNNLVQSIALDSEGNTYVTGIATGTSGSFDFATIKISVNGQGLWTNIYDGPGHSDDEAVAVALDPAENVYVTGTSIGAGGSYGYVTIKYSNAGVPVWTNFFNGIGNRGGEAVSLAVDGSGSAYVTGTSFGGLRPDEYVTIKYATGGAAVWTNLFSGGTAAGVAADTSGNAYVTGNSGGLIATIQYSAPPTPLIFVTTNGNFGRFNNHFLLSLSGPTGSNAIVSATTNFQTWIPIATNPISGGSLQVTDTLATNVLRFYRAQLQ